MEEIRPTHTKRRNLITIMTKTSFNRHLTFILTANMLCILLLVHAWNQAWLLYSMRFRGRAKAHEILRTKTTRTTTAPTSTTSSESNDTTPDGICIQTRVKAACASSLAFAYGWERDKHMGHVARFVSRLPRRPPVQTQKSSGGGLNPVPQIIAVSDYWMCAIRPGRIQLHSTVLWTIRGGVWIFPPRERGHTNKWIWSGWYFDHLEIV